MSESANSERLVVDRLSVSLGRSGVRVVDDVSFTVATGEILALVGESGSGKTTVALALLGHARRGLTISSGSVRLNGDELVGGSKRLLRSLRGRAVAYVAQDPGAALDPGLKVVRQLREVISAHRGALRESETADERIMQVLAEAGLDNVPGILKAYPHQLSGGQQQRVAIAMAFAARPSLIVADEPTTGLDVRTQKHVLSALRSLCTTYDVGAVYVSHDLAVVGEVASSVAVFYAGRVVEHGPTHQIFGRPGHPYTIALLRAVPSMERPEILSGIGGSPPPPDRRPKGCAFAPRCSLAVPACREVVPTLRPVHSEDQWVACIRAGEVSERQASRPVSGTRRAAAETVLEVERLSAFYGTRQVLHEVSIEVPANACVAIVGESGSGKTTLARCLIGMHRAWSGHARFMGVPLETAASRRSKDVTCAMQYIFQNPYTSLNPRRTIGQAIAQPLGYFTQLSWEQREARVRAALEDVALSPELASRYPDQLSGGERQRAAIARALVVEPRLLICDEVTAALDVSVQAAVIETLRSLQLSHALSLVFITHNLAVVRAIAQFVVVLSNGAVVESGATDDVLECPEETYTRSLMAAVPRLPARAT